MENRDLAYRIYITDSIRVAWHLNKRWWGDVIQSNSNKVKEDGRDPKEIIQHISDGLDKLGKEEDT